MRYRHTCDVARSFPELGLDLEPGQEFETELPVNHPELEPIERPAARTPAAPKGAQE